MTTMTSVFYCWDMQWLSPVILPLPYLSQVFCWEPVSQLWKVCFRGHQCSSHTAPPPPYLFLMVEGLQSLTAALKLESTWEYNRAQECLDCPHCLSLLQSPWKMPAKLKVLNGYGIIRHITRNAFLARLGCILSTFLWKYLLVQQRWGRCIDRWLILQV